MIPSDIYAVLQWWLTLLLLGIGFLPLTMLLFQKFFDKGYIFSKLLALAITSYALFLVGILHITPFTAVSSYIIFILIAGGTFFLLPTKWKMLFALKQSWRIFLFEELLFLAGIFTWAYVHSFAPDIHGLEKYMDYGFINSILRAEYFPPKDMWLTPHFINYYYFGHLMTAVLTKLSGLASSLTFNLMLSTIFAFCLVETFSVGANLYTFLCKEQRIGKIKRIFAGLLSAALVTVAGNLHILYAFFKPYPTDGPLPFWRLAFSPETFPNSYWYPNATRYIFHTIHEFPIYSWVVADLHGHVLDIPFVLLIVALLLSIFMDHDPKEKESENPEEEHKTKLPPALAHFFASFEINPLVLMLIGFLLSVMYMTNAWDGAIYLLLTAFVIIFIHWQKLPTYKHEYVKEEAVEVIKNAAQSKKPFKLVPPLWKVLWGRDTVLSILFTAAALAVFTVPYNIFFKPFVSGIGILCAPDFLTEIGKIGPFLFEKDHCQRSYLWELMVLYGFFYFFIFSFIFFLRKTKKIFFVDYFVFLLIILGTLLIIIPEFIYVKDIYPAHYRANTMFKLVFQAFIILGISSGYIIVRILWFTEREGRKITLRFFSIITVALLVAVLSYPNFAINSYYGNLKNYHGLDGIAYLKTLYPTDAEAIAWLNKTIVGQPVILEAQGDSYTDYARVSANTGLPTVLGWTVHEWLWRGSYDVPAPRITDVKTIYETTDATVAKDLMKKYNVKYVFIGSMEYQKYPTLSEGKFTQLGKVVYENGNTTIYEITNP